MAGCCVIGVTESHARTGGLRLINKTGNDLGLIARFADNLAEAG